MSSLFDKLSSMPGMLDSTPLSGFSPPAPFSTPRATPFGPPLPSSHREAQEKSLYSGQEETGYDEYGNLRRYRRGNEV